MNLPRCACLFAGSVGALALIPPRTSTAALPTDFADQLVTGGFSQPMSFDFLPDGRVLVVEKATGNVWVVANGVKAPTPALSVTDLHTANEQGLLGIARDPGWPARPYVYLYFDRSPGTTIHIVRTTASGDLADGSSTNLTLSNRYVLLNDIPDNTSIHNGGTLRFGPDGMLYASVGEDGSGCFAQDSTDFRGSIIRMNVSALPDTGTGPPPKSLITPADNPFPPTNPVLGLIDAFGFRNPFRFHIDPTDGTLYIGDVGQSTYEELDACYGGENFGWPFREGPSVYTYPGCSEPGGPGTQTYTPPIAWYDRTALSSAAITGWPRYHPVPGGAYSFPPRYNGVVFFSDFYGAFVRAIENTGGTWAPVDSVPGQPDAVNWATGYLEVTDTAIGPADGAVYYTNLLPGELRRIVYTGSSTGVEPGTTPRPLLAARPNPFRSGDPVILEADGGKVALTRVRVYTASGRLVRTLEPAAGSSGVAWDGRDAFGRAAAPGVYVAAARWNGGEGSIRVVLVP